MPRNTMTYGLFMIAVGVASYFGSPYISGDPHTSPTALIPAAAGIVMLLLGYFMRMDGGPRMIAAHLAVLISLALLAMTGRALGDVAGMFQASNPGITLAPVAKSAVAIASAIYTFAAIRSFMQARMSRATRPGDAPVEKAPRRNLERRANAPQD